MSIPSRPTMPYIGIDDPHAQNFFTKSRVQKHLRRAGLLNRDGEILTQAEYDSKQTDVAIGRENRRKIDDAITEVLNDMAREHWSHTRDHMELTKKNLMYQFQRITEQYRRRTQPITIRHTHDGQVKVLPKISSGDYSQRSHTSQPSNTDQPNDLKNELANFDRKINTRSSNTTSDDDLQRIEQLLLNLQEKQDRTQQQQENLNKNHEEDKKRIDELDQLFKSLGNLTQPTELDKQKIEYSIKASTIIQELRDSIFNLEISFRNLSAGQRQEPMAKANEINEGESTDMEQIIETLVRDTNEKIKQLESQVTQLSTELEVFRTPITHVDINQLNENKPALEKIQELDTLHTKSRQQRTTTSPLVNKSKSYKDLSSDSPISKEFQAIMPFIELLPTFDMFNENEWD